MYQSSPMPSDKMMRLFIIQAISSFVAHDYDSGLHYLNEIKMSFAEFQSSLNPTLKTLAKEIIQSLDMFAPGSDSSVYKDVNTETATPQQKAANTPQEEIQQQFQQQATEAQELKKEEETSVTSNLQDLLARRRARKRKS